MKFIQSIKERLGIRFLHREPEPNRERRGYNFNSATRIGVLYLDSDESFYNQIRFYARQLKERFDVKSVICLGYVNEGKKKFPSYQVQKLELNYFAKEDLNWHLKPLQNVESFLREDFDILLDLSGGNSVPLNYVLKESKARMKVGLRGTKGERYYDFLLNMGTNATTEQMMEQLNMYLSNPKIK